MHPQTIAVLQSRADGLGLTVEVGDEAKFNVDKDVSGVLVQYPATDGTVHDYKVCIHPKHVQALYLSLSCPVGITSPAVGTSITNRLTCKSRALSS